MHILIVTPLTPPDPGGPSYYSASLKDALEKTGEAVDLIAFSGVRKYPSGIRHIFFFMQVLWAARRADAMIILDTVSVALPAVLVGKLLGIYTTIRTGGDFVWERYVERTGKKIKLSGFYTADLPLSTKERLLVWLQKKIVFRLVNTLAFSTEWQRTIWMMPYALRKEKTTIIQNAYNIQKKKPVRPDDPTTFLFVGRSIVLKNLDVLERVFEAVQQQYPRMVLKMLTNVSHKEVLQELKKARCLVLPSVSDISPNILFEALAEGVPVVSTDDTGVCNMLADTAYFVDTQSEESVQKALEAMCKDETYAVWCDRVNAYTHIRDYVAVATDYKRLFQDQAISS